MIAWHGVTEMQRTAVVLLSSLCPVGTLVSGLSGSASAVPHGFTNSQFASGLNSTTACAAAPDGRIFVTSAETRRAF
jgi:hypothetical protein